jgi:predicted alpha-1,2-mannosidase
MNLTRYLAGYLLLLFIAGCKKDFTQYVDPNIGGVAPLLTTPGPTVHRPNSMIRVFPITQAGLSDKYFSDKIFGFPLNIPAYRDRYVTSVMATSGKLNLNTDSLSSLYDHSLEEVHPWFHHVWLQDFDIDADWTTTERTILYKFSYNRTGKSNLIFRLAGKGNIEIKPPGIISGWEEFYGFRQYFYCSLKVPFQSCEVYLNDSLVNGFASSGDKNITAVLVFDNSASQVELRTGISYIGIDQAKLNLEKETNGKSFDKIKTEGHAIWKRALGKIELEGGTEREKRIFYTSLYRTYERMVNISEDGRYYSAYDSAIHDDHGEPFYVDDWLWDTFRSLHPLMTILNPDMQVLQLKSYIRMYEQGGWMPLFPQVYGDEPCMLGNHSAALIADAYAKGLRGFDLEKAFEGIRKNALEGTLLPWRNGPKTSLDDFYNKYGWFPALPPDSAEPVASVHPWEKRQSVAVTLEQSLDDGCTAFLAKALGRQDDYNLFQKRSKNYRNVFNPATGFMSPKRANGQWVKPFDPQLSAWYGGRMYFAENNSYTWTWNVTHDIPGLIELMGGKQNFGKRLDELFNTGPRNGKWMFMGQFPDASGLQGMFVAGNEPSFHIPYLYNYCGEYWKTQRRIRQIMDVWFDDSPLGLPGDEDGGAMCAWYVFSAMGFYPVAPGTAEYAIGSPIFKKITIHTGNGTKFVIEARNCSSINKYIQSAKMNGKYLKELFFTHKDIVNGGHLLLEMGSKPKLDY